MSHQFQEEVRQAMMKYALTPVIILAVLGTLLIAFSWDRYVTERNEASRQLASEVIMGIFQDYQERTRQVNELLSEPSLDWSALRENSTLRSSLYAELYHEVNITQNQTMFYLLDTNLQLMMGSRNEVPEILRPLSVNWGMLRRLQENPGEVVIEFSTRPDADIQDLLVGCAISQHGAVKGYFLFIVPGEYLRQRIASPYQGFVLEDGFSNAVLETGGSYADALHKLADPFRRTEGKLVSYQDQEYYVTHQPVTDAYKLYAILPVTDLLARYLIGAGMLLVVVLIMLPIIRFSVRRESRRRGQAVDELVEAFAAVKHGDLERQVVVKPGSELAVVAEAYNHMTKSLRTLMQQNEAEARASLLSEVRQLESQFNPHFLFNTLENIKFMARLEPEAAVKMIMSLSELLRYSINNTVRRATLAQDLDYTHSYIRIQQYRFGSRLHYEETIDQAVRDCQIPKLLIQPVLENAIKYGEAADGTITVRVQAQRQGDCLLLTIQDDGMGMPPEKLAYLRQLLGGEENSTVHTGLYNIHRRIQLMYGTAYGVTVTCQPERGTCIQMSIPFQQKGADDAETDHC
ncbi:MAG: sensor histidine kinase [Selenomonas sp.]|jgi:two-component system sensor histidine kinase YesM|nr:sensor histidine kinase [Selenomonas sp.]